MFLMYILACYFIISACGLTLPNLTTRKPRITKYMTTPSSTEYPGSIENLQKASPESATASSSTTTTTESSVNVFYRLNSSNGATCVLIQTDALLSIKYNTSYWEEREVDVFVPNKPQISGDCKGEDVALMYIAWPGFKLTFRFEKTPGGERWYLDKVELVFDTENRLFEHLGKHDRTVRLTTSGERSAMLFPTPVGRSFQCGGETAIPLEPSRSSLAALGGQAKVRFSGNLLLRDLRVQPFMYKSEDFDAPFACSAVGYIRDETAPIAVGSTLAVAVLATITGYGVFRYFKVKKVQYDTME